MLVGVLLAAGGSRRMGRSKALVRERGRSFTAHGLGHLWSACDAVVIVLGADAPRVRAAIEAEFERLVAARELRKDLAAARRHGARGLEARFVVNRSWRKGMLDSVRRGLAAALRLRPQALLVLPVDHPAVQPRTVQALGAAMVEALGAFGRRGSRRGRFAYALVPRFRRRRGHPIALSPALAAAVLADRGAADLSDAVRRSARLVGYLDCTDSGVVRNVNAKGGRRR
jgi:CTP:molybdopterin cytidylyltransferase MocA